MTYRIHWATNHACGTLPGRYANEATAERAARCWKREMVAMDDCPRAARAEYQWEVVFEPDCCECGGSWENNEAYGMMLCASCGEERP